MVERQNKLQNQYECNYVINLRINFICRAQQKGYKEEIGSIENKIAANEGKSQWKKCNFGHSKINETEKSVIVKKHDSKREINA